jgi:hypothetical protein
VKLTRKEFPWEWREDQEAAMADLKEALINSPALKPLDYESDVLIILAVDTLKSRVYHRNFVGDGRDERGRFENL